MDLILTVVIGAAVAGFIQGLSGFGFGLTAMALWVWTLDPRLAASLALFGALTGQTLSAVTVRRGWDWRALAPFIAGGLAGMPLGIYLLPRVDIPVFKLAMGIALVILCPLLFFSAQLPKVRRGGRLADALAGAAGGVTGGLAGSTGVVPTLWCTVRGLSKDRQRAIIQNFNLAMLAVTFAGYLATGIITSDMLPLLAIVAPAMMIPSLLGARVYLGMSESGFRQVVLGLLSVTGLALLGSSFPVLLARWTPHGLV
jgi:uncharacterized membrane protein YfcA